MDTEYKKQLEKGEKTLKNLKIEYLSTDKLTSYPNNSKIHTKDQIQHIANSIKQFGFNDPLGICGD